MYQNTAMCSQRKKVQVGNDQEKAQSERNVETRFITVIFPHTI